MFQPTIQVKVLSKKFFLDYEKVMTGFMRHLKASASLDFHISVAGVWDGNSCAFTFYQGT